MIGSRPMLYLVVSSNWIIYVYYSSDRKVCVCVCVCVFVWLKWADGQLIRSDLSAVADNEQMSLKLAVTRLTVWRWGHTNTHTHTHAHSLSLTLLHVALSSYLNDFLISNKFIFVCPLVPVFLASVPLAVFLFVFSLLKHFCLNAARVFSNRWKCVCVVFSICIWFS